MNAPFTFNEDVANVLFVGFWSGGGVNKETGKQEYKRRLSASGAETLQFSEAHKTYHFLLGRIKPDVVMTDYDDADSFECRLRIAEALQQHCIAIKSTKGGHIYWANRNHRFKGSESHTHTLLTIPYDYKCGINSNGSDSQNYGCVSLSNGSLREVVYCNLTESNELDEIPFYDLPVKCATTFLNMKSGDSRNQKLFEHMIPSKNAKAAFSYEEYLEAAKLINEYVFSEPLDDDEFASVTRREKWDSISINGKKTVSPETFAQFLIEKGYAIRYNEMLNIIEYSPDEAFCNVKDKQNQIPTRLQYEFQSYTGKNVGIIQAEKLISFEADRNAYNPVQEYLTELKWDGVDRFSELFNILGVEDEFQQTMIRKWFYQGVALAFNTRDNPIQAEGVLILGSQTEGIGKTRFFEQMAVNPMWFKTIYKPLSTKDKDTLLETLSAWITEVAECDRTFTEKRTDLKSFITSAKDTIRKPYAREQDTKPRTTNICGTTNKTEFLNTETGYRRWWYVPISKEIILTDFVKGDTLQQFWAQCYDAVQNNPLCFRMSKEENEILKQRNSEVTALTDSEDELRLRFDFEAPTEKWIWVQASQLRTLPEYWVEKYSSEKIGKALAQISREYSSIRKSKQRGTVRWFIPPAKPNVDRLGNG